MAPSAPAASAAQRSSARRDGRAGNVSSPARRRPASASSPGRSPAILGDLATPDRRVGLVSMVAPFRQAGMVATSFEQFQIGGGLTAAGSVPKSSSSECASTRGLDCAWQWPQRISGSVP